MNNSPEIPLSEDQLQLEHMPSQVSYEEEIALKTCIELALINPGTPPFLDAGNELGLGFKKRREEEKILNRDFSVNNYLSMGLRKAFIERTKSGRPTNRYKASLTPELAWQQRQEMLENTIQRLGDKYYVITVETEQLAEHLHLHEAHNTVPETVAKQFAGSRANTSNPAHAAYKRFLNFIDMSSLFPSLDLKIAAGKYIDEAVRSGDPARLTWLATKVLGHELKRAEHFQFIHDKFATQSMEDRKKRYGDELHSTVQISADGQDVAPVAAVSSPEETPVVMQEEVEVPTEFTPEQKMYQSRFEHFWRSNLALIKNLGRTALKKVIKL